MDLFRSDETFVSPALAQHYGLPSPGKSAAWVRYPDDGRRGILSHGTVLSNGFRKEANNQIFRGRYLQGRFLCRDLLAPDGVMLLQAITIDDRAYEVEKATSSFINQLIFPGGCLPSVKEIQRCVGSFTELRTIQLEDITPHYVTTLAAWRERFEAAVASGAIDRERYDRGFQRIWSLYLAYCEGGFAERRIQDVQLLLAGPHFRGEAARDVVHAVPDRTVTQFPTLTLADHEVEREVA
jgi:hypothetical protein